MQLPEHVYRTLVEVCEKYPHPVIRDTRDLGDILNLVAWIHRRDEILNDKGEVVGVHRWGLSRKTGGTRVDSPVGEIAEDILQLPNGHHFDVLGGAGLGKPLNPGRATSIGIIDLNSRPWVAPVEYFPAWWVGIPTTPPPTPIPPAPVCACRAEECKADCDGVREDIEAVYELIAHKVIDEHIGELYRRLGAIEAKIDLLVSRKECRFLG